MLKFENVAKVGDYIRGYDFKPFKGRGDCYVEGTVLAITEEFGYKAFKIEIERAMFDDKLLPKEELQKFSFVPMETSFGEFDGRVMNLSRSL